MHRPYRKPRVKPATANEYRLDRDYWKRKARKQQRIIDTLENRAYQSQTQLTALRDAHDYFRNELQRICPHVHSVEFGEHRRCTRCQLMLNQSHPEKRRNHP